jgi:hypothetical protein
MMNRVVEFIPAEWISRSAGSSPPLTCYSRPIVVERRAVERRIATVADINALLITFSRGTHESLSR